MQSSVSALREEALFWQSAVSFAYKNYVYHLNRGNVKEAIEYQGFAQRCYEKAFLL